MRLSSPTSALSCFVLVAEVAEVPASIACTMRVGNVSSTFGPLSFTSSLTAAAPPRCFGIPSSLPGFPFSRAPASSVSSHAAATPSAQYWPSLHAIM